MDRFQFTVEMGEDDEGNQDPQSWLVSLPHQCDSWMIAGEAGGGVSLQDAEDALMLFIKMAGQALDALREGRELNV